MTNDLDIAAGAYFYATTQPIALTEDRSGLIRAANPAFLALGGSSRDEVVGRSVFELGLWSDAGQWNSFLSCLAIEGRLRRYPLVASRRYRDLAMRVSADPVPEAEGTLLLRIEVEPSPDAERDEPAPLLPTAAADCFAEDAADSCPVRSPRSLAPHSANSFRALNSALSEKETLLREIHHRVKNNLQIIASLLNLQTDRTDDPEAIQVLSEAADRVQSMALVHTMLYGSRDLTSIDAGEYLRTLALQILRGSSADIHGVELRFSLESLQLDTDRAIPVGLIVNELVTNALKYGVGLPGTGYIEVGLSRTAAGFEIVVADSGARLPRDFRPEAAETLGMQLVLNLTRQLKGRVEFAVGEDTRFRIHFPL